MKIPITVVIPTFNRSPYLPKALDSGLGQTLPTAESFVVGDGSTDARVFDEICAIAQPCASRTRA